MSTSAVLKQIDLTLDELVETLDALDHEAWHCDKRGVELLESLEGLLSARAGGRIVLR